MESKKHNETGFMCDRRTCFSCVFCQTGSERVWEIAYAKEPVMMANCMKSHALRNVNEPCEDHTSEI